MANNKNVVYVYIIVGIVIFVGILLLFLLKKKSSSTKDGKNDGRTEQPASSSGFYKCVVTTTGNITTPNPECKQPGIDCFSALDKNKYCPQQTVVLSKDVVQTQKLLDKVLFRCKFPDSGYIAIDTDGSIVVNRTSPPVVFSCIGVSDGAYFITFPFAQKFMLTNLSSGYSQAIDILKYGDYDAMNVPTYITYYSSDKQMHNLQILVSDNQGGVKGIIAGVDSTNSKLKFTSSSGGESNLMVLEWVDESGNVLGTVGNESLLSPFFSLQSNNEYVFYTYKPTWKDPVKLQKLISSLSAQQT